MGVAWRAPGQQGVDENSQFHLLPYGTGAQQATQDYALEASFLRHCSPRRDRHLFHLLAGRTGRDPRLAQDPPGSTVFTVYYGRKTSGESPQGAPPMAVDTDSCLAACRVIICMNAEASESPPLAPEAPKTVVGTLRLANASAQTFWVST